VRYVDAASEDHVCSHAWPWWGLYDSHEHDESQGVQPPARHRESAESRKKSNRKYRISSYGLTQENFDRLLDAQQHTCGMCHEPFEEGQFIHVDHDHACCRAKNRSCGKCIRGLLCHTCNIALGHIERRYAMARAYLDSPPVRLLVAA